MSTGHHEDLSHELHVVPDSSVLNQLTEADAALILRLLREARERQVAEVAQAEQNALSHLPRGLRGPVRRILMGSR